MAVYPEYTSPSMDQRIKLPNDYRELYQTDPVSRGLAIKLQESMSALKNAKSPEIPPIQTGLPTDVILNVLKGYFDKVNQVPEYINAGKDAFNYITRVNSKGKIIFDPVGLQFGYKLYRDPGEFPGVPLDQGTRTMLEKMQQLRRTAERATSNTQRSKK